MKDLIMKPDHAHVGDKPISINFYLKRLNNSKIRSSPINIMLSDPVSMGMKIFHMVVYLNEARPAFTFPSSFISIGPLPGIAVPKPPPIVPKLSLFSSDFNIFDLGSTPL